METNTEKLFTCVVACLLARYASLPSARVGFVTCEECFHVLTTPEFCGQKHGRLCKKWPCKKSMEDIELCRGIHPHISTPSICETDMSD